MKNMLYKRIVIGKSAGFALGILDVLLIPAFSMEVSLQLTIGIVLWYILMGAVIALAGVMDRHPQFNFKLNAWSRGILLGGAMNLILVLIAFGQFEEILANASGIFNGVSPYWFVLEGAVVGLIIDLIATKYAGEGPGIVSNTQ